MFIRWIKRKNVTVYVFIHACIHMNFTNALYKKTKLLFLYLTVFTRFPADSKILHWFHPFNVIV